MLGLWGFELSKLGMEMERVLAAYALCMRCGFGYRASSKYCASMYSV